ncbi:hypothetical protein D5074_01945 [Pectobacterium polaris]|nr:hypothetical protein [Pectobacterium carotovorum subsp. carotovorum]POD93974.1 hypothetical protein BV925_05530 [Pectobacterium odoriferum]RJL30692.1 hypothetical protein D5074_01945 [Pectobacterium polaris]
MQSKAKPLSHPFKSLVKNWRINNGSPLFLLVGIDGAHINDVGKRERNRSDVFPFTEFMEDFPTASAFPWTGLSLPYHA